MQLRFRTKRGGRLCPNRTPLQEQHQFVLIGQQTKVQICVQFVCNLCAFHFSGEIVKGTNGGELLSETSTARKIATAHITQKSRFVPIRLPIFRTIEAILTP